MSRFGNPYVCITCNECSDYVIGFSEQHGTHEVGLLRNGVLKRVIRDAPPQLPRGGPLVAMPYKSTLRLKFLTEDEQMKAHWEIEKDFDAKYGNRYESPWPEEARRECRKLEDAWTQEANEKYDRINEAEARRLEEVYLFELEEHRANLLKSEELFRQGVPPTYLSNGNTPKEPEKRADEPEKRAAEPVEELVPTKKPRLNTKPLATTIPPHLDCPERREVMSWMAKMDATNKHGKTIVRGVADTDRWTEAECKSLQGSKKYVAQRMLNLKDMVVMDIDADVPIEDVLAKHPWLANTTYCPGNSKGWHFYLGIKGWSHPNIIKHLRHWEGDIISKQIFERRKTWIGTELLEVTQDQMMELLDDYWQHRAKGNILKVAKDGNFKPLDSREGVLLTQFIKHGMLDATRRDDWLRIGFAINNTFGEDGYELFDEFSKLTKEDNYGDVDMYTSWTPLATGPQFGSIMHMAQKLDPIKYHEITKPPVAPPKRVTRKNDVTTPNEEVYDMLERGLLSHMKSKDDCIRVGQAMRFTTTFEHYQLFASGVFPFEDMCVQWEQFRVRYTGEDIETLKRYVRQAHPDYVSRVEADMREEAERLLRDMNSKYTKLMQETVILDMKTHQMMSEASLIMRLKHLDDCYVTQWLRNPRMSTHERAVIAPPPVECEEGVYNLWRPFGWSKVETWEESDFSILTDHIYTMCCEDKVVYDYVIAWIAQMLQYPGVKSKYLLFMGGQGAGKGTFADILKALVGAEKYLATTSPEKDIVGPFNGLLLNAFLVCMNEVSIGNTIEGSDRLKGLITDVDLTINQKGVPQFTTQSYHRFFSFTNKPNQFTEAGSRRNVFIRVNDKFIGKADYFQRVYAAIANKNIVKSFYEYLMSIPNMVNFGAIPIPVTEYARSLVILHEELHIKWMRFFVRSVGKPEAVLSESILKDSLDKFYAVEKLQRQTPPRQIWFHLVPWMKSDQIPWATERRANNRRQWTIDIPAAIEYFDIHDI
jgi:hypothetical protein